MSYLIQWDNEEKTVVLQQYMKGATKDDWYQLAKESAQMLSTVSHTVHLIIDERNVNLVANAADMRYLEKNVPPNEGVCVLVVPRHQFFYKNIMKKLRERLFPMTYPQHEALYVDSIEEARKLLQERFAVTYSDALPTL